MLEPNDTNSIDPAKDVDGFHPINVGNLVIGIDSFVPCTPLGCSFLLKQAVSDLSGKDAIVIGRSTIVGKPMATLLLESNCTVTIAHSRTRDLADKCRAADIVIAAVGRPEMIKGDWIKEGATVIDVGINRCILLLKNIRNSFVCCCKITCFFKLTKIRHSLNSLIKIEWTIRLAGQYRFYRCRGNFF